jgi:ABC-type multidrug transport system ATPase subunit
VARTVAIDVQNLTKRYKGGTLANDGLSLRIQRGEIFGLLGPNGAGKTTLVLQLLGLLTPTAGTIVVEGVDVIAHPDQVKEFAGYMPQARVAMRNLEVERALYITGRLRGQADRAAKAQAEELIERLDLGEYRRQFLDRLSGGLIRVAAFAMALMGTPRLVILDEPTNELDPIRRRVVWDVIRGLSQTGDLTCLLVTHNVLEAERAVDRVAMIDRGKVAALGTPGELKARLGDEIRLEVVLRLDGGQYEAALTERLARLGRLITLRPGHHAVFVPREGVGQAIDLLLSDLAGDVDDFRLAPPSLEDVYIELAGQKIDVGA